MLAEVLLPLRAGDLVHMRQHPLERPVLLEQLRGGLVPDPRDAGDVVGGVALQPDEVGDQLRRHAVALDHALAVVDARVGDATRGGHDPDAAVVGELVGVPVAGHDHHVDALLAWPARRGLRSRRRPRSPRRASCGSRTTPPAAPGAATARAGDPGAAFAPPCRARSEPRGRTCPRPRPRSSPSARTRSGSSRACSRSRRSRSWARPARSRSSPATRSTRGTRDCCRRSGRALAGEAREHHRYGSPGRPERPPGRSATTRVEPSEV